MKKVTQSITRAQITQRVVRSAKSTMFVDDDTLSDCVSTIIDACSESLERKERIEIRGFGSFNLREWGERQARNPVTGESWRASPKRAVHFKPGEILRAAIQHEFLKKLTS